MAIHPLYAGLTAEVVVGGEPLKEYDDDDYDGERHSNIVEKYVQVKSDALFGVRYTIPMGLTGASGVRANLKVDGKSVRSFTHNRGQIETRDVTKCLDSYFSVIDGMNCTQKLRFAPLHIDEEEADAEEMTGKQLKNVGILTLRLTFIDSISQRDVRPELVQDSRSARQDKLPVLGKISEKSLKGDARSHQASLDGPVIRSTYVPANTENVYNMGQPFAVFQFKYRSAAALKSLQVMPRTPRLSPHRPVGGAFGEIGGATGRLDSRPRMQDTKQEAAAGVKHEANGNEAGVEVEFVSSKRLKKLPTWRDEVIALD